jgi:23S rRNA U2552 (ribose-2'-O)-methylase RlmE/FtsJ
MELIIFSENEISIDIFIGKKYEYKKINNNVLIKKNEYGNYELLDYTKSKLENFKDSLDPLRRAAAKYYHDFELVKVICKKNVVSRSYFKIYEFIYFDEILNKKILNCMFLCEAPGGFIDAVLDMRRMKNLTIEYLTVSKYNQDIDYNKYINKDSIMYADITNSNVIDNIIQKTKFKFPFGLDLITADGGFDVKKYNSQEIIIFKLLLSEIIIGLSIQKEGGVFIIKFFDMFTHNSIVLYLILCSFYKEVKISKPLTSRNSNSERYLICKGFVKTNTKHYMLINDMKYILKNYIIFDDIYTFIFPHIIIPEKIKNIRLINNNISNSQIETINKSVNMVINKNTYINNLILKIFTGTFKLKYIYEYNMILNEKIKKSIHFLKKYNLININIDY